MSDTTTQIPNLATTGIWSRKKLDTAVTVKSQPR